MLLLGWMACAGEPVLLVEPDPAADGAEGRDGPLGAVLREVSVQARVTERLPVDVVHPAAGEGPWPTALFVQGGLVTPDRYRWLAAHLATRGYAVVLPHHDLDLAITEVDDGVLALRALADGEALPGVVDGEPAAALGHSLGGVVGALSWAAHDELGALALLASYPAGEGPVEDRPGSPVLSVAGTADGSADPADVRAGFDRLREPRLFASVEGLTHYAWTDDPSEAELEKDGEPGRPLEELRLDARRVLDAWLDHALLGAPEDWDFGPTVEVAR